MIFFSGGLDREKASQIGMLEEIEREREKQSGLLWDEFVVFLFFLPGG